MARNDDSIRFQITMSKAMTEKVQALADDLGISRSAAVNVLVSQGFQTTEGINVMKGLMDQLKSAQDLVEKEKAKQEQQE